MTPDEIRAHYSSFMDEVGETILIRRWYNTGLVRTKFECEVRARSVGETEDAIVGDLHQGMRRLIVLIEDLERMQFPLPITTNDYVVIDGKQMAIAKCDDQTRRVQGVLIALELSVRG